MDRSRKDPSDEREGGSGGIITEKECCADGCCSWHENTPAQSEEREKGGPREWTDD